LQNSYDFSPVMPARFAGATARRARQAQPFPLAGGRWNFGKKLSIAQDMMTWKPLTRPVFLSV